MRKIKVLDKDMNHKGYIDDLDGAIDFSVTENGFGPLDFTVVGDADIEHSDLVKVIDTDGQTIEEIITNNTYLRFDGTNDYVRSGFSQAPRSRTFTNTGLTLSSDGTGDYLTDFGGSSPAFKYVDIGGTFDEIEQSKSFSIKLSFDLQGATGVLFQHNDFSIRAESSEIRIGWIGGTGVSFSSSTGYYRFVIVWDGATFTAYQNSILIAGTNAPSGTVRPYSTIGHGISGANFVSSTSRRYGLCFWNRVLTSGEITAENASHVPVTTSNRFYNVNGSGLLAVDNIIDTGIVSGDLTTSTNICISGWFRLRADAIDSFASQNIAVLPYIYVQVRNTNNQLLVRYDNAGARQSSHTIGNGDRQRHHFVAIAQNNGSTRQTLLYMDGVLRDSDNHAVAPSLKYIDYIELAKRDSTYYNGDMKDIRIHTYTGALNANDALRLYQGLDPQETTAINEYVRYDMNEGTGTILSDKATIYNGASRITDNTAPFAKLHNRVVEQEIYYGQVIKITPTLQSRSGKRTIVNCLGIQTVLNDRFFRGPTGNNSRNELMYPYQILQYVYDQNEYKYLDYIAHDKLVYKDWLRDRSRRRYWMYISTTTTIDPFGQTQNLHLRTSASGNLEIEQFLDITPDSAEYICSVWLKSESGNKTAIFSYGSSGGAYFVQRTYTVDTVRRRYSIRASRGDGGGGIKFKIQINGNIYISNPIVYRGSESNLEDIGTIMEINYNNTKLIKAFQDAIEYSGAKIQRTTNMYPVAFTPDITNTPNHYLIEEKHLSFLEKGEYSDEIINSVQVEYETSTTASIRDTTSIDDYREREGIVSATNLVDATSATNYGNVYLAKNKDPKTYVKAVVTRDYPLHSLRVGDLCQINGNTLAIDRGYITRLDMNDKQCTIYLDHYDGLGKSLSKL